MLLLIFFCYYPAFNAIKGSFYKWDGFNDPKWRGLKNYEKLFKDDVFILSIKNVFKWAAGSIAVSMLAPMIGALMIFNLKNKKIQYWYPRGLRAAHGRAGRRHHPDLDFPV